MKTSQFTVIAMGVIVHLYYTFTSLDSLSTAFLDISELAE